MRFEITQGGKGDWTRVGKIPEEQLAETGMRTWVSSLASISL